MSTQTTPRPAPSAADRRFRYEPAGRGWVNFAGVVLGILGCMNVVYGIEAIGDARVFVNDAEFVITGLSTWGWILLGVGAVQIAGAFGVFAGNEFGRWIGIVSATGNAMLQLLFMPAFPLLALSLLALNILVIYALIAYGGRRDAVS